MGRGLGVPRELQRLLSLFCPWKESVGGGLRRGKFSSLEGKHGPKVFSIMTLCPRRMYLRWRARVAQFLSNQACQFSPLSFGWLAVRYNGKQWLAVSSSHIVPQASCSLGDAFLIHSPTNLIHSLFYFECTFSFLLWMHILSFYFECTFSLFILNAHSLFLFWMHILSFYFECTFSLFI